MKKFTYLALAAFSLSACMQSPDASHTPDPDPSVETEARAEKPALLTWGDLLARDRPEPTLSLTVGDGATDIVDVWLPDATGPHPVVLMVHGGCWQKAVADRTLMNYAAEDLRQRGLAVWNIEYRGVDEDGGGYPGTYQDVARAADALKDQAANYDLDLSRIAGIGHSAGGHLVTWLATRETLPEDSPLRSEDPLPLIGLINSGGLADLEASVQVTQFDCLGAIIDQLTGLPSEERANVFADTSPAQMLPVPGRFVSVSAAMDRISPPGLADEIAAKDQSAGGYGQAVIVPGNNHVDLIAPGTAAWDTQAALLEEMLTPGQR